MLKIGNKVGQILKKGLTFSLFYGIIYCVLNKFRGIAQLVEHWSPKPSAEGSSPSAPAMKLKLPVGSLSFVISVGQKDLNTKGAFFVKKQSCELFGQTKFEPDVV